MAKNWKLDRRQNQRKLTFRLIVRRNVIQKSVTLLAMEQIKIVQVSSKRIKKYKSICCFIIVRFSLLLCSVILYLSSISDNLNSVSVVENTIWEQWSSCTQTCFSHSSVMPKRTRSGKSKNGVDIRQDGVCEGEMQVCPFGKLSFLGPVTCSF